MLTKKTFFTFLFAAVCIPFVYGAHIIGGVLTYQCDGPGEYSVTMKIYRDCQSGGANFDSDGINPTIGTVSIYRGSNLLPSPNPVNLSRPTISQVLPEENPCLVIPPGVCVEEGTYNFNLSLPISNETYTIVYSRCCRNASISNLVNPSEVGATYFVQINPFSQDSCFSSTAFRQFPPIVICQNEDLRFDHSAIQRVPGSQLVYSLCAPFVGGGQGGTNGDPLAAAAPDGVAPNPDLPPPYTSVPFQIPNFTFDNPLGVAANIQINPISGLLTGRPLAVGQYVVGVCAQEFLNGVLVSEIRRDFQFNVGVCEQRVFADVVESEILNDGTFFIRSCGDRTVELVNESQDINFIESFEWEIDNGSSIDIINTQDVTYTFPDTGIFSATLYLNRFNMFAGCRDTAEISIGVFGAINADFEFDYDTCVSGPIEFSQLADTENDRVTDFRWNFNDGDTSMLTDPIHTYQEPGTYTVSLEVEDNRGCVDEIQKDVLYFPIPALVVASPDRFLACNPGTITFNNLSSPINEEYIINWSFGDGGTAEGLTVEHTFEDPGLFTVDVEIVSPIGCQTDAEFRNLITIRESPEAGFIFTPEELNDLNREVFFTNQSSGGDGYQWTFGDGGVAFIESPIHEFADTGVYETQMIVFSDNGCTDTATAIIDVEPLNTYFLPNAFSPNQDGLNDEFRGKGITKGISGFSMLIWNRWGELVFEGFDPMTSWNGESMNGGQPAPKGVYHCQVEYTTARGERRSLESSVTLLR